MNLKISSRTRQRQRKDHRMKVVVTAFGALVLLTLIVLVTQLLSQAAPLLFTPAVTLQSQHPVRATAQLVAVDDMLERQSAVLVWPGCRLQQVTLAHQALSQKQRSSVPTNISTLNPVNTSRSPTAKPALCHRQAKTVEHLNNTFVVAVTSRAEVTLYDVTATKGKTSTGAAIDKTASSDVDPAPLAQPPLLQASLPVSQWQQVKTWRAAIGRNWLVLQLQQPDSTTVHWINRQNPAEVFSSTFAPSQSVLTLPDTGLQLVTTGTGLVMQNYQGQEQGEAPLEESIGWWQSLPKDRTVLIANNSGKITRWVLQNHNGKMIYQPTYSFALNPTEQPLAVAAHPTANALALSTSSKRLLIINRVTGEIVTQSYSQQLVTGLRWYATRLYAFNSRHLDIYQTRNLSGITTWASLFEPQQYEGYLLPQQTWQSSTATDFQEQKFSLTPLLMGSIKASFLALIIAIPMAISAAIYTGYFAHAALRAWVKPAIEMLEAIPSVVIGFIAAIWLTPMATHLLVGVVFFIITLPLILVATLLLKAVVARRWTHINRSVELLLAAITLLVLGAVCFMATPEVLHFLSGGQGAQAFFADTQSPIGKTSLVVAIALGLAVSPGIYSLAEDAIHSVPSDLKRASFALGATPLQTLYRVVLHVAMPGVLAAIMLGFGRAFGETMIVLMVTGNTPIASWSLFEGLRALTANLAIELPEAEVGSAHYQILFFTACLLFGFTFIINTVAELLRQRLRRSHYHG